MTSTTVPRRPAPRDHPERQYLIAPGRRPGPCRKPAQRPPNRPRPPPGTGREKKKPRRSTGPVPPRSRLSGTRLPGWSGAAYPRRIAAASTPRTNARLGAEYRDALLGFPRSGVAPARRCLPCSRGARPEHTRSPGCFVAAWSDGPPRRTLGQSLGRAAGRPGAGPRAAVGGDYPGRIDLTVTDHQSIDRSGPVAGWPRGPGICSSAQLRPGAVAASSPDPAEDELAGDAAARRQHGLLSSHHPRREAHAPPVMAGNDSNTLPANPLHCRGSH